MQSAILTNKLQVADILHSILKEIVPSRVWQTTFSISEEFLRRMFHIRREGLITDASLILDHKASVKTLKLWPFISQVYDRSFMSDNHSKLLLLQPRAGDAVSVITSQNLTRGNRFESTFITRDPSVFTTFLTEFESMAAKNSVPLDDLLRPAT